MASTATRIPQNSGALRDAASSHSVNDDGYMPSISGASELPRMSTRQADGDPGRLALDENLGLGALNPEGKKDATALNFKKCSTQNQRSEQQGSGDMPRQKSEAATALLAHKALPQPMGKSAAKQVWPPRSKTDPMHKLYSNFQIALSEQQEIEDTKGMVDAKTVLQGLVKVGSRYMASTKASPPRPHLEVFPSAGITKSGILPTLSFSLPPEGSLRDHDLPLLNPTMTSSLQKPVRRTRTARISRSVVDISETPISAPPIALASRAVHPFFLRELLRTGIPVADDPLVGNSASGPFSSRNTSSLLARVPGRSSSHATLRESSTLSMAEASLAADADATPQGIPPTWSMADLVNRSIKPATANAKMSYIQALICGVSKLPWCPEGRFNGEIFKGQHCQGRPVHGPATYFVCFSYAYKFEDLLAAILNHYNSLPETAGGAYAPIHYWISAFAVNKNQGPDIRKSPDSSFETVLYRCRAVLLACKPWFAPSALTRAWCLYECLVAIHAGVELVALQLDASITVDSMLGSEGLAAAQEKLQKALNSLDIRLAHCTSRMDHTYLLSMVERRMGDPGECAVMLGAALKPCFMSSMLSMALTKPQKDYALAIDLIQSTGAQLQLGPAFFSGPFQGGDAAAICFGQMLSSEQCRLKELVMDPTQTPVLPSGSQALTLTLPGDILPGQHPLPFPTGGRGGRSPHRMSLSRQSASPNSKYLAEGIGRTSSKTYLSVGSVAPSRALSRAGSRDMSEIAVRDKRNRSGSGRVSRAGSVSIYTTSPNAGIPLNSPMLWNRMVVNRKASSPPSGAVRMGGGGGVKLPPEPMEWTLGGWAGNVKINGSPHAAASGHLVRQSPASSVVLRQKAAKAKATSTSSMKGAVAASASQAKNADIPPSRRRQPDDYLNDPPLVTLVTEQGAAALAQALRHNACGHLFTLSLSNNQLGNAGVQPLFKALQDNFSLRTLMLRGNDLDDGCAIFLAELFGGISANASLTCLDLGGNALGPAAMVALAKGLPRSGIRDLRLDCNDLESDPFCVLAKALPDCASLLRLDLSRNLMTGQGAEVMAAGIAGCPNLQALLLAHNRVGSKGVLALTGALLEPDKGKALKSLVLRDNDLGIEAGVYLADFLASSPPLSCLDLALNPLMGSIGVGCLAKGLQRNTRLVELRLEGVLMDLQGATALSLALTEGAPALRRLDISDNKLGDDGAEAMATNVLGVHTCRLHELAMSRCDIRSEGRLALMSCMQANATCPLRHLHLVGNKDPHADPSSGARLVKGREQEEQLDTDSGSAVRMPAYAGALVVAEMTKTELLLAQALNIGRQLKAKRRLMIYE
ncbi:hypothetical protein CEUSTIGMA_g3663.t1 [Chlamydomonas eustigma]|uniref:Uncharacterized protein n=1 Tax=Chlamydomonas eustigma TaxID=1157962 RepID=A0A250WZU9_9CHLO|nr:hypothetical protein CEUSTIGMA_g3663.t1 [Chlamydomonas eustigma]|eukprot:GAX76219.1 hypothetical protein CEUSTIGMA_g3663.t1 [Chlamydomonas eustigma]